MIAYTVRVLPQPAYNVLSGPSAVQHDAFAVKVHFNSPVAPTNAYTVASVSGKYNVPSEPMVGTVCEFDLSDWYPHTYSPVLALMAIMVPPQRP